MLRPHLWDKKEVVKSLNLEDLTDGTPVVKDKLFDLVIEEGQSAKESVLVTDINIRATQHYVKKYKDDEE